MGHVWLGVALTTAVALPQDGAAGPQSAGREPGERAATAKPAVGETGMEQPARARPPVRVILPSPYSGRR